MVVLEKKVQILHYWVYVKHDSIYLHLLLHKIIHLELSLLQIQDIKNMQK